jgi:hypothetical protein
MKLTHKIILMLDKEPRLASKNVAEARAEDGEIQKKC